MGVLSAGLGLLHQERIADSVRARRRPSHRRCPRRSAAWLSGARCCRVTALPRPSGRTCRPRPHRRNPGRPIRCPGRLCGPAPVRPPDSPRRAPRGRHRRSRPGPPPAGPGRARSPGPESGAGCAPRSVPHGWGSWEPASESAGPTTVSAIFAWKRISRSPSNRTRPKKGSVRPSPAVSVPGTETSVNLFLPRPRSLANSRIQGGSTRVTRHALSHHGSSRSRSLKKDTRTERSAGSGSSSTPLGR